MQDARSVVGVIPPLFFFGTIALFVAYCVGMARLWKGRPKLAFWSAVLSLLLGMGTMALAVFADRYSTILFGSMGFGDGFGMVGLIIFAAGGVVGSFIALFIAGVTYVVRQGRAKSSPGKI